MGDHTPEDGIGPVSRESTASVIARRLRHAMEDGSLEPGTQLGERDLAGRMRVSRGPLREAMQRLVQEGLLRSEPNRGLFVIDYDFDDVYDIYLARTAIERAAAAAVLDLDPASTATKLRRAHTRMVDAAAAADFRAFADADLAFHEILVADAQSSRLKRIHDTLLVETRMCLAKLERSNSAVDHFLKEHGAIVEAILDGDRGRLNELITEHANDALARLANSDTVEGKPRTRRVSHL